MESSSELEEKTQTITQRASQKGSNPDCVFGSLQVLMETLHSDVQAEVWKAAD